MTTYSKRAGPVTSATKTTDREKTMEKFTYAAWAAMSLRDAGLDGDQEAREAYWSKSGRIAKYDEYRAYCKSEKKQADNPPEGYWESKEQPWHKPAGVGIGLMGVLTWFLIGIIGGATGSPRR